MSKCIVLCATCHQKIEREGNEALDDVFDIYNRRYGNNDKFCVVDSYPAPGDETSESFDNRTDFIENMNDIPIEIVASFERAYLDKYGMEEGFKSALEAIDDDIYWQNRTRLRRIETGN